MNKPKIIAIVGPTASGKTGLSIELAKRFDGEVISADSRQVYKGLDIGSGKVTQEEMEGITHHLLDVANPSNIYSASDFKRDGEDALEKIIGNKHLPIIAGGTFFYLDTLRGKQSLAQVPQNSFLRKQLEKRSTQELFNKLLELDVRRAENIDRHNRHRLIRALEIIDALGAVPPIKHGVSPYEWLIIGIDIDKDTLHDNIHKRLHARLDAGMIEEVQQLHVSGVSFERLEAFGLEYRYIALYLQGKMTYETMVAELETRIRQFAKRQMTWLKRDKQIEWFKPEDKAQILNRVAQFLSN